MTEYEKYVLKEYEKSPSYAIPRLTVYNEVVNYYTGDSNWIHNILNKKEIADLTSEIIFIY